MNIVITTGVGPGAQSWGNMGDVAQLQACVARLAMIWPTASLSVITDSPESLLRFCPTAVPLPAVGRSLWIGEELPLGPLAKTLPPGARNWVIKSRRVAARRFPKTLKWVLHTRLRLQDRQAEIEAVSEFSDAMGAANLVVLCGAGGFYDGCPDWNAPTFDVIEAAVDRGIPVAMFAQHFGPLTDPEMVQRAKSILPGVDLIGLRGNPGAPALLESFGVQAPQVLVTGDEAVELAFEARGAVPGEELGVNFRLRASTQSSDAELEAVAPILHQFARKHDVSLIPVPISVDSDTSDHLAIKRLLQGFDDTSNGGVHLSSPHEVIRQVSRCRVVVTCAYHAAVFALSQGIPVVALAKSAYFTEKFSGLRRQFGDGCDIVALADPNVTRQLSAALDAAWVSADQVREPLQQAAMSQIAATWAAYRQIEGLVDARRQAISGRPG